MSARGYRRASPFAAAGAVIALHAAVLFALLQLAPVRTAMVTAVPVMVTLISPPREKPAVLPKPQPPKAIAPRPRPRPAPQPPVITAAPAAPSTFTAPPPPAPVPAPPVEVAAPAPVAVAPAPSSAPAPAPAPVIPPSFLAAYLDNPVPAYPPISRRLREEGKVVLRVFVNERGQPQDVQVKTSSGFSRLDETALESVRQWKFVPGRRGETPIGAWVLVPLSFSLRS